MPQGMPCRTAASIIRPRILRVELRKFSRNITFTVRLAPGTFDPATTLILIYLDTDENRSTGIVMAGGLGD